MGNEAISWTKIRLNIISKIIVVFSLKLILKFAERLEKLKINLSSDFKG